MRRRDFSAVLGAAAAWPFGVHGQPTRGRSIVGYLDGSDVPRWFEAFRSGLAELGYRENQSIVIERRSMAGSTQPLPEMAAELVHLNPPVIVASGSRPALALKSATTTIPIVVAFATDPVGMGLVASLARPGGNITGLSNMGGGLMSKRLELLAELVPGLSRVGVVWSPSLLMNQMDFRETQAAAVALNLTLVSFGVAQVEQFDSAFEQAKGRTEAVAVLSGPLAFANREVIVAAAARHKVRAIYYDAEYTTAGGLVSYGPSLRKLHHRAAVFVDKILKGAKPADLPVEQPSTFELVINAKVAKASGFAIASPLLARADEVIE